MIHTLVRGRTARPRRRAAVALLAPLAIVALGAVLGACPKSSGLPPGFGQGTQWAIPILGALGEATPLAAVTIDGKGPYLFAVDVNAPSAVDPRLARELGLAPAAGQPGAAAARAGETGPGAAGAAAPAITLPSVTLGNLTVAPARFEVRDVRATHHGRPVQGSIGREILHASLLWTLDRDRQSLYLGVRDRQAPPQGAQRVAVRAAGGALLVEARVSSAADDAPAGATAVLRVDFDPMSVIRPELAAQAGLTSLAGRGFMADEVHVGEASGYEILFSTPRPAGPPPEAGPQPLPPGMPEAAMLGERRRARRRPAAPAQPLPEGVDGVLGQRFWARFLVAMHLAESAMWLAPRADEVAALTGERLARWGALFDGCADPACVTVAVTGAAPEPEPAGEPDGQTETPGKPPGPAGPKAKAGKAELEPEPRMRLAVTRDPRKQDEIYDVLLQAFDEADAPLPAPYVLVFLPKGVTEVAFDLVAIDPAYERATSFRVVDATPFPPPCRDKQGCFWLQR